MAAQAASRVESSSRPHQKAYFSSSSLAKMLQDFDYKTTKPRSSRSYHKSARRSTSGSGLTSSTSGSGTSGLTNVNKHHVRYQSTGHVGPMDMSSGYLSGRTSSTSSLTSSNFDGNYDHLYSYSSNLDLFEHQLFKSAARKRTNQPSNNNPRDTMKDFDLMMETQLLMDRTNQLVGKKPSDQEWVI